MFHNSYRIPLRTESPWIFIDSLINKPSFLKKLLHYMVYVRHCAKIYSIIIVQLTLIQFSSILVYLRAKLTSKKLITKLERVKK
jgi:hypothetical protein